MPPARPRSASPPLALLLALLLPLTLPLTLPLSLPLSLSLSLSLSLPLPLAPVAAAGVNSPEPPPWRHCHPRHRCLRVG